MFSPGVPSSSAQAAKPHGNIKMNAMIVTMLNIRVSKSRMRIGVTTSIQDENTEGNGKATMLSK